MGQFDRRPPEVPPPLARPDAEPAAQAPSQAPIDFVRDPAHAQPSAVAPYFGIEDLASATARRPQGGPAAPRKVEPAARREDPAPDPAQLAADIFRACDGFGTDEDAIHTALRGRSPGEIKAIRLQYAAHYGKELDTVLGEELGGSDLADAQAALTGDPVQAAAASLVRAMDGLGTDEELLTGTLRSVKPADLAAVKAEFARRANDPAHAVDLAPDLDTALDEDLGGTDNQVAKALAAGDTDTADAAILNDELTSMWARYVHTDQDAIDGVLERRGGENSAGLNKAYRRVSEGGVLADDLAHTLGGAVDNPDWDLAAALYEGKPAQAAAARLERAARGAGTDEGAIFDVLGGKTSEERGAIAAAFDASYGAGHPGERAADGMPMQADGLQGMLREELGDMDLTRGRQLATAGALDPAFAMEYAMDGFGTDTDLMTETLAGLDANGAAQLRATYQARYGDDLQNQIEWDTSGRDEHYLVQGLRGMQDQSLDERLKRSAINYEFERGEPVTLEERVGRGLVDAVYDAGPQLDADNQRMWSLRDQQQRATGEPRADLDRQLGATLGYTKQDTENYHAAQDAAADTAATGAAAAVGTAVSIATYGAGAPAAYAMFAGGLGGGLAGMYAKHSLLGPAYTVEAAGTDAALTGVSAMTGLVGGELLGEAPSLARTMLVNSKTGAVNGLAQGMLDEKTWRGPGNGAWNLGRTVLSNAGGGLATGLVGSPSEPTSMLAPVARGAAGGLVGSALQTATAQGAFDGRAEDVALRFAKTGVPGAIVGGTGGGLEYAQKLRTATPPAPPPAPAIAAAPPPPAAPPPAVEAAPPAPEPSAKKPTGPGARRKRR